jgi:hypothetical protein
VSTTQKTSEAEQQRRARQRETSKAEPQGGARQGAMSIADFCRRYGVGRTTAYEEIRAGRLRARKCGKRTAIGDRDAEDWWLHLPVVAPDTAPPVQHP